MHAGRCLSIVHIFHVHAGLLCVHGFVSEWETYAWIFYWSFEGSGMFIKFLDNILKASLHDSYLQKISHDPP